MDCTCHGLWIQKCAKRRKKIWPYRELKAVRYRWKHLILLTSFASNKRTSLSFLEKPAIFKNRFQCVIYIKIKQYIHQYFLFIYLTNQTPSQPMLTQSNCLDICKYKIIEQICIQDYAHLTHLRGMEFPILLHWTSPIPFLELMGGIFHFYSNFKRNFWKPTVENLIRRRALWSLIWLCTACRGPTKRTLGLNGLKLKA